MRLIDADELITAFPCGESVRTESVRATINHMPTIDAIPLGVLELEKRDCGFADQCDMGRGVSND